MTKQVVMMSEPFDNVTPKDVRKWLKEGNYSEKSLAVALACAHNKFWWVEDDLYDYEENSEEYKSVLKVVNSWGELIKEIEKRISFILKKEGVHIPKKVTILSIKTLVPFMDRNGYYDGDGWWIEKED